MSTPLPARGEDDLTPADHQRLEAAYRRLRDAVDGYAPYLGGALPPGESVQAHHAHDVAQAQAAIEAAEDELWRLREELLGWTRPASAPRATQVAEWFSDEDRIYDEPAAAS